MFVTVVVVTFNRLPLLKECIEAIRSQTTPVYDIVVINNSSTDGTTEWLQQQEGLQEYTMPNRGGSWGFYEGIKKAYATSCDWIWIMDDDSIPSANALEKLLSAVKITKAANDDFGFFGSKVVWSDGSLHKLNMQLEQKNFSGNKDEAYYRSNNIIPVAYNSFVSFLVSKEVVKKVGLPVKEFFIWNDDVEYSMRVLKNGYKGAMVTDSLVVHKTPHNYSSDIFTDDIKNIWKHVYGIRNEFYIRRHQKSYASFLRNIFKKLFIFPFKIIRKRKDHRFVFIKAVWKATGQALSFNPPIEYITENHPGKAN
ncbi:MAG: glycosyltransferase family 2 protein [Ferruginibacter sp.]